MLRLWPFPLLGERSGGRRWSAVVIGLAGVILVLRPTGEGIAAVALLPLGSAVTLALRDILTRRLSVSDSSSSILMFTTLAVMGASLASSLADPLLGWKAAAWQPMTVGHVAMLAVAGVLLAGAQYAMIEAVRLAEIGLVAPFKYTRWYGPCSPDTWSSTRCRTSGSFPDRRWS